MQMPKNIILFFVIFDVESKSEPHFWRSPLFFNVFDFVVSIIFLWETNRVASSKQMQRDHAFLRFMYERYNTNPGVFMGWSLTIGAERGI